MKYRLLTVLFSLIGLLVYGQTQNTTTTWKKLTETDEVLFESTSRRCTDVQEGMDQQMEIIRVTNKTNNPQNISWLNALFYDGTCATCDHIEENTHSLTLKPNEIVEGTCGSYNRSLLVFASDHKKFISATLTDVKIYRLTNTDKPQN